MVNSVDDIYGTNPQIEFARKMAESLLKEQSGMVSPEVLKMPGGWRLGIPSIINALAGTQYRDIAGSQESKLINKATGSPLSSSNLKYGGKVPQPSILNPSDGLEPMGSPIGVPNSGLPPTGEIETGSLPQKTPGQVASLNEYIPKLFMIESGNNPNSINKFGYRGLGQFSKLEEKKYGITDQNWRDPEVQRQAALQKAQSDKNALTNLIGREPTWGEVYLAHQQGIGGAANHINNPDKPAWQNMYNTAEGKQKGIEWAKNSIKQNLPKELQNTSVDAIPSSVFSKFWTSRFDGANSNLPVKTSGLENPLATTVTGAGGVSDLPGKMGLGGPPAGVGGPPAAQLAQTSTPNPYEATTSEQPNKPGTIFVPGLGYVAIPPVPQLPPRDVLNARVRLAPEEERDKIISEYEKKAEGKTYELPTGQLHVAPREGGGEPIVSFTPKGALHEPGATFPQVGPKGEPGFGMNVPGSIPGAQEVQKPGENKTGLNNPEYLQWLEFQRQKRARDIQVEGTATERTSRYAAMEKDIQQRAVGATVNKQMLSIAKSLINDPAFYSGTGANRVLDYTKVASIITGNPNWSGSVEAFSKVMAGANIAGLEAFKGYGQIRNPEISLLQEASGNVNNSPGALRAIVDINIRASTRLEEIGQKMQEYREKHGELGPGFDKEMTEFYRDKPLFTDEEIKNYRNQFKSPNKQNKDEILPNGVRRRRIE